MVSVTLWIVLMAMQQQTVNITAQSWAECGKDVVCDPTVAVDSAANYTFKSPSSTTVLIYMRKDGRLMVKDEAGNKEPLPIQCAPPLVTEPPYSSWRDCRVLKHRGAGHRVQTEGR